MAYMNQEKKKNLAPAIKAALKKHGLKGSISVENHTTIVLKITAGVLDFYKYSTMVQKGEPIPYPPAIKAALRDLNAALDKGNYHEHDQMSDYGYSAWFTCLMIGTREKKYILIK